MTHLVIIYGREMALLQPLKIHLCQFVLEADFLLLLDYNLGSFFHIPAGATKWNYFFPS